MEIDLYYKITLINNVNNHKFQYCINLNSCIAILKIIERNYNKKICNCRLINYINKIFQNNYDLNNTNSIKIIYDKKILYETNKINKSNKQKEFMNNIIIKITEKYKFINKIKRRKIKKIKNNIGKIKKTNKNKNTYKLNEFYMDDITNCYNRYKRRIKQLKRNMLSGNFTTVINNNIKENNNDLDEILEINILEDKIIENKNSDINASYI